MFTGIVEELGEVVSIDDVGDSAILCVRGPVVTSDAALGDSIAVNGVCLTVTALEGDVFTADVMKETLDRSSLGDLNAGGRVNLERPVTLATRLSGHLVQGHVDATGTVQQRTPSESWEIVRIAMPVEIGRYVVEKGSITVDGISLTVMSLGRDWFTVSLIPTTLERTTLGAATPGTRVNLEVDVIAKYVEKLFGDRS